MLQLQDLFAVDSETHQNLERYRQIPCENNGTFQGKFTLSLLEYLLPQATKETLEHPSYCPHISIFYQAESALKKQIAQEKLLNKVTSKIRQSLDLPLIIAREVEQVRAFLELDRLVIYKFEDSIVNQHDLAHHSETYRQYWQDFSSCVVYEARASDEIISVLNYQEINCFTRLFSLLE
ncbi:MAG: GAF domain-containing protein [Calothrix sp. SM1_7_51]|nr:GAF domain-containing protein [Calothrix sp. SM1_7_51]